MISNPIYIIYVNLLGCWGRGEWSLHYCLEDWATTPTSLLPFSRRNLRRGGASEQQQRRRVPIFGETLLLQVLVGTLWTFCCLSLRKTRGSLNPQHLPLLPSATGNCHRIALIPNPLLQLHEMAIYTKANNRQ